MAATGRQGTAVQLYPCFGWPHSLTILALNSDRLDEILQLAKEPAAFSRRQLKQLEAASGEVSRIVEYSGVREMLLNSLPDGMQRGWRAIRSVDLVVEETAKEFEGKDPLLPHVRACVRPYLGRVELVEPDEAEVDHVGLIPKSAETLYKWAHTTSPWSSPIDPPPSAASRLGHHRARSKQARFPPRDLPQTECSRLIRS